MPTDLPRILYVDDYAPMGELLQELLQDEGFDVTLMDDPERALQGCGPAGAYAAAVVDLNMPVLDGEQFIGQLRAAGSSLPVVLVSGRVDAAVRERGLRAGASAVLDKRQLPSELPGLLRRLLEPGA